MVVLKSPHTPAALTLTLTLALAAALPAGVGGAASAHVAIQPQAATTGAYQVLRFAVGHGCGDTATTALRIEIPHGMQAARPQPKPGWTVEIVPAADGAKAPSALVWRGGPLPADQFDEFLMLVRLPAQGASVAFPAIQTCGETEVRWVEEPTAPGEPRPRQPAPVLRLTPPATSTPPSQTPEGPQH